MKQLLSRKEAAEYLGFKTQTLAKWASEGTYDLPLVRIGKKTVRYRPRDLDEWIAARLSRQDLATADGFANSA